MLTEAEIVALKVENTHLRQRNEALIDLVRRLRFEMNCLLDEVNELAKEHTRGSEEAPEGLYPD